jgi:hypothetical protein
LELADKVRLARRVYLIGNGGSFGLAALYRVANGCGEPAAHATARIFDPALRNLHPASAGALRSPKGVQSARFLPRRHAAKIHRGQGGHCLPVLSEEK